jgi:hypothetical protein
VTKRKSRPTERRPARHTDDAELAFTEASALLGFGDDPSKLCGADRIRVGMVAGLTAAVDAATESLLAGNSSAGDIGRLTSSVEALVRLLPKATTEPVSQRPDPRVALLEMLLEMRERAGIPPEGVGPSLRARIVELETENAKLKAAVRAARAGLPINPRTCDIVPASERAECDRGPRAGPDDPKEPTVIDADAFDIRQGFNNDQPEPWRAFSTDVEGNPLTPRGRRY